LRPKENRGKPLRSASLEDALGALHEEPWASREKTARNNTKAKKPQKKKKVKMSIKRPRRSFRKKGREKRKEDRLIVADSKTELDEAQDNSKKAEPSSEVRRSAAKNLRRAPEGKEAGAQEKKLERADSHPEEGQ